MGDVPMTCRQCNAEIFEADEFCGCCGTPVARQVVQKTNLDTPFSLATPPPRSAKRRNAAIAVFAILVVGAFATGLWVGPHFSGILRNKAQTERVQQTPEPGSVSPNTQETHSGPVLTRSEVSETNDSPSLRD